MNNYTTYADTQGPQGPCEDMPPEWPNIGLEQKIERLREVLIAVADKQAREATECDRLESTFVAHSHPDGAPPVVPVMHGRYLLSRDERSLADVLK